MRRFLWLVLGGAGFAGWFMVCVMLSVAPIRSPQCRKCERGCLCVELSDCREGKCDLRRPLPLPPPGLP